MLRRACCVMAVLLGVTLAGPLVGVAAACPMCKAANETEPNRPRAYMYSILFMLAVPATLATAFGIGFYRLARQQAALSEPLTDEALHAIQSR